MGYYKIKSHAGTGKLLNIAASGPISGRKNTNIWDESCPIDQTWSIASLGNNQQVRFDTTTGSTTEFSRVNVKT